MEVSGSEEGFGFRSRPRRSAARLEVKGSAWGEGQSGCGLKSYDL